MPPIAKLLGRFAALTVAGALFASCRPSAPHGSDTAAFSNRPQAADRFIAIVKLHEPALLTAKVVDPATGTAGVDPARAAALEAEQQAFLAKLARKFPEARVLFRYRMVLNGVAVVAPKSYEEAFRALGGTSYVECEQAFTRLAPVDESPATGGEDLARVNSVAFIGAQKAREELGVDGRGIRVGVIDTGIDFTHKMFGGAGTSEAYRAVDVNHAAGVFPTPKVVGGIDLAGTAYDSGSPDFAKHIPVPDDNPLDESGHGTHVAGTIAGVGDGEKTYTGVAPGASLYAIKVFGKDGSTGDAVIIAALEYAADPNRDLRLDDQLDVVNLSLGSEFGTPRLLYSEAMTNLVRGGTITVASGGNSGNVPYIVGAPGTTADAVSVAASVDDMPHNWRFAASAVTFPDGRDVLAEAIEAAMAKPIAQAGDVRGPFVDVGFADQDLDDATAARLKGKVALIDRGKVPFCDKATRAEKAGAIGFVVANNLDGDAFAMGGDCTVGIPGIMITKALGAQVRAALAGGDVTFAFDSGRRIDKPQLIDTLTDFSSRGPRSVDGLIKPEVAAPGSNIISAKMGGGDAGVKMSGTSMAAPHVAGVAALLRAARPGLSQEQYKSLLIDTAKPIADANKAPYPIAMQGAGRVQTLKALTNTVTAVPATLSLGEVKVNQARHFTKTLTLTNVGREAATYALTATAGEGLRLTVPASVTVAAGASVDVPVQADIKGQNPENGVALEGSIAVTDGKDAALRVPVLAVVSRQARLALSEGTPAQDKLTRAFRLENKGSVNGALLPFALLGVDARKANRRNAFRNNICDLGAVGYRIVETTVDGEAVTLLQVAAQTYDTVTTWNMCELSVQVDTDGDSVADKELLGTTLSTLTGNNAQKQTFASVLTDAAQMRSLRKAFEAQFPATRTADYTKAILDVQDSDAYHQGAVVVVSADLAKIGPVTGRLALKVAMQIATEAGAPEADDFLGEGVDGAWFPVAATADAQPFPHLPASLDVTAGASREFTVTAREAGATLVLFAPRNQPSDVFVRRFD